ncbi:hydrogenase maturation nickel metallochaperone HypA [Flavobacterium sp. '19STA2R22 D10 B1']|uniref:hydrogenase maturation nickel metallochaperone HypA/HybF n=1 Tax=Flavobacterium aerium TaxID=3037261 RepID=UPI00278C8B70|nr:hydrogenase maturation nickel metallochaperone HypA [Flavobacterium sp. '19STA2R22 D10 B1']
MHELSIVKDIFQTLEEQYGKRVEEVEKIEVTAGLLCNVQPILIQNAFDAYTAEDSPFSKVELEVRINDIIAFCETCQANFEVYYHRFVCPCGTPSHVIIQGNELYISKVIFKTKK